MAVSPKTTTVSTKLLAVAERAKQWPHTPLRNLPIRLIPDVFTFHQRNLAVHSERTFEVAAQDYDASTSHRTSRDT